MLSTQDVLDYLGIDYADDMINRNIQRLMKTADMYLQGWLGTDYPKDDPRAVELALVIINDMYDNRTVSDKVSSNTRRLVEGLALQLKCELLKDGESNA